MQARILAPLCRTHGSAPGSARTAWPAPSSHCHAWCVSVANSSRSDGAPPARWIRDIRAASSRASTSPEFMLCTPTGAAWCAASPASQTPPLPKLRARRHSNDATRRPVNLRRPRRAPGSPRRDQLVEPLHRCLVFRDVPNLESPAASSLLEGPVDARQVGIENDAHFGGKLPGRLDLVDGEDLARAMLGHLDASHPPHGRVVPVGADHIVRSDRRASHNDPLPSRDGIPGRRPGRASRPLPGGSRRPR